MAKKDWAKTTDRYIAYIDIMGFKKMVNDPEESKVLPSKFTQLINNIRDRRSQIDYYIYSDLIVVITQDNSLLSLKKLLEVSIKITSEFLNLNWGMSGSISKGKVFYDRNNHIILGRPIVEAYLMQEDVEFYGIAICDSAIEDVKKYIEWADTRRGTRHLVNLLREERIHFKSGYYSQYHLRWFDYEYNSAGPQHPYYIKKRSDDSVKQKLQKMLQNTQGKSKRYIENTLDLI